MQPPYSRTLFALLCEQAERYSDRLAVISGGRDTAAAKMEAMRAAGIHVAESPAALGSTMVEVLKG